MKLQINGQSRDFSGPLSVLSLLETMGLGERRVAVELNQQIVPRSRHGQQLLAEGDQVEIIQAIGGG
jgi:sulfur carrier protein